MNVGCSGMVPSRGHFYSNGFSHMVQTVCAWLSSAPWIGSPILGPWLKCWSGSTDDSPSLGSSMKLFVSACHSTVSSVQQFSLCRSFIIVWCFHFSDFTLYHTEIRWNVCVDIYIQIYNIIQATVFSSEIPEISIMLPLFFINHHLKSSKMCCHSYKHFAGHQIDKGRPPKFDFIVHWTGRSYRNLSKLRVVEYILSKETMHSLIFGCHFQFRPVTVEHLSYTES